MKRIAIVIAVTALAGCGETAEEAVQAPVEEPVAEPAEAAGMVITPGLYAVGDDTTEYAQTRLNDDGTYVDMAEGVVVGSGTWTSDGASMCFDPEGDGEDQQVRCWTNAPPDEDGSFMTTRDDQSMSYRVTPIAE